MTLRQLLWMCDGRRRESWDHTSYLLAATINANRGRGVRPVRPREVNPYLLAQGRGEESRLSDPHALAAICGVHPK